MTGATMPLSGEAIRTMNYVDDISVTLRRILTVLPSLTDEERQRVADHIKGAELIKRGMVEMMTIKKELEDHYETLKTLLNLLKPMFEIVLLVMVGEVPEACIP